MELLLQLDAQLGPQHGEEARAEEVLGEEEEAELMRLTLALTLSLALTLALALALTLTLTVTTLSPTLALDPNQVVYEQLAAALPAWKPRAARPPPPPPAAAPQRTLHWVHHRP